MDYALLNGEGFAAGLLVGLAAMAVCQYAGEDGVELDQQAIGTWVRSRGKVASADPVNASGRRRNTLFRYHLGDEADGKRSCHRCPEDAAQIIVIAA